MGGGGDVMSTLTKCCGCAACESPILPAWSVFGPTASEDGTTLTLTSSGDGGVTSVDGAGVVFASVNWRPGTKQGFPGGGAEVAADTTIEVPLWCNSDGDQALAVVRLKLEIGEKFCSQIPYVSLSPAENASLPTSHIVTRDIDAIYSGSPLGFILGERHLRSSWRSIDVTLELDVNGNTVESVVVPAIVRAQQDRYGSQGLLYAIGMQVFAAKEDGELDVAVALSDRFLRYAPYPAAIYSTNIFNNVYKSIGLEMPAQWHLFETVSDVVDQENLTYAGIKTPLVGEIAGEWLKGDVSGEIWGYSLVNTHTPGIPEDDDQYCDEENDDYIPPEQLATETDERSWGDIPWVHTPCTRWVRRSRITQSLPADPEFSSLSIQFPPQDDVLIHLPEALRPVYGFGLLGNTIELTGFKGGQRLADNTFWYEAQPNVEGENGQVCNAVQVSAVLCVEVGRSYFQYLYGPAPPCDNLPYDEGWRSRVFLDIASLITDANSGKTSIYRGSVELSMKMNSRFMRGYKINSYGYHARGLPFFGTADFVLNGWQTVWPEYLGGDPAVRFWQCYRIEQTPQFAGSPPIDQNDDDFEWWRVQLL
jgi:hypothetical protein